jgi:hypothetical protein
VPVEEQRVVEQASNHAAGRHGALPVAPDGVRQRTQDAYLTATLSSGAMTHAAGSVALVKIGGPVYAGASYRGEDSRGRAGGTR